MTQVDRRLSEELPPGLAELTRILDHLPGMVAFWDQDGHNRYANHAYCDYFDTPAEQLRGKHVSEILGPELYTLNRTYIEAALAGEPQEFERTMVGPGGSARHVRSLYVPNVVDGVPTGFFVLNSDITTRVRTEQALRESARQVALLEERQRIAADLHDFVIQRLFAAGLDLSAAQQRGEDAWERVDRAAEGVDESIRELRKAIHSLRELMAPREVPESIERLVANAARVLGFTPSVTYTGSLDGVEPEVFQELLAVLNEALSNVARHAEASSVLVTLACSDGHLLLRVADDGKGIGGTARSSGLSNMRKRAERLGGAFVCRDNEPHGTVVDWSVPVRPGGPPAGPGPQPSPR